ncbi:L-threonylcarbamoyladenylate synthase [Chondromyces apiculatus]|uniref:Threonylcarbamoyl-AMP synthase n=1 Tax=Chondromyces apiculatus DSM 436 TaxID=1192034 RepID=A0A017T622_9BACT|nr:L-threonylcarbamoyladenylate synthase [Chondromyces apiculatus]EYF04240.1 TsaC protein required for threonylcarbamoyladenosine [Chondromyces apiculatus DSM 436]
MRTERLSTSPASIARAASILRAGGLVAFPTETVYGIGARADDSQAARKIFAAKGRPTGNPLIVHGADLDLVKSFVEVWPDAAQRLAAAYWPGPLTLILARRPDRIADEVAAGGPTVALRVPAHPVARALLEAAAVPIAAPSANRSSEISPTTADHVWKALAGRIDAVIDGGPCTWGIESTIVDVTGTPAILLRHGAVPAHEIAALVPLEIRSEQVLASAARAPAPGLHARHYAPRARVFLVEPQAVRATVEAVSVSGQRVGTLEHGAGPSVGLYAERLPSEPTAYAADLYAALHRLEDAGCEILIIAHVPEGGAWDAVRDRLRRASAGLPENP